MTRTGTPAAGADSSDSAPVPAHSPSPEQGSGLGVHEHCVTDRPSPGGQKPAGEIIKLDDIDAYVSKPESYPQSPARLLLFLTGGTGVHSTNNQLQADRFARDGGFVVVMPDLFAGDAAPNTEQIEGHPQSALDALQQRVKEISKSFMIDMWMARHTEARAMPLLYRVLESVHDEFADAVTAGGGVYAVGYCIGGRYVLLLGNEKQDPAWGWKGLRKGGVEAEDEEAPRQETGPLIKVGAVAHPAQVVSSDFATLKVPTSLVCVETDPLFQDDVRTAGEDAMNQSGLEHEVKVYPGVPHGFAVVGEYQAQNIRDAQAAAYEQILRWLSEH